MLVILKLPGGLGLTFTSVERRWTMDHKWSLDNYSQICWTQRLRLWLQNNTNCKSINQLQILIQTDATLGVINHVVNEIIGSFYRWQIDQEKVRSQNFENDILWYWNSIEKDLGYSYPLIRAEGSTIFLWNKICYTWYF